MADIATRLDGFFHGLQSGLNSLREIRAIYDQRVAFAFNSVSFFEPDENKTSDILAFFLKPDESHGQKTAFLRAFLNYFDLREPLDLLKEGAVAKVEREHRTEADRRIDIVVTIGDGQYMIGIENKIGAGDQDRQIEDYALYLKERAKAFCLFYLTPDGHRPEEHSICENERRQLEDERTLRVISYEEHIIELLSRFEMVCQAENVRAFIRDLRSYLAQKHLGESIMGEEDYIAGYLAKNSENAKLALGIVDSLPRFHQAVWDGTQKEVRRFAEQHDLVLVGLEESAKSLDAVTSHTIFEFRPIAWKRSGLRFRKSEAYFWVTLLVAQQDLPETMGKAIQKMTRFRVAKNSTDLFQDLEYSYCWSRHSQPWRDMLERGEDGQSRFVKFIADITLPLIQTVEQAAREAGFDLTK